MKLVLIALTVELLLARLITGSWAWALVVVAIYCTFVYIRERLKWKKQDKEDRSIDQEYTPRSSRQQVQKYSQIGEPYLR